MSTAANILHEAADKAARIVGEAGRCADEALRAYARSKARLDAIGGPLRGDLFERRARAWRTSMIRLDRAALALRLAEIDHYLARRALRRL